MQPITKQQITEFFKHARTLKEPPDNYQNQFNIDPETDNDFMMAIDPFVKTFSKMALIVSFLDTIIISCIITGFQLGRLYEHRKRELEELDQLTK